MDDVERDSKGRWSASAIGAYERGFRNLSLPRLQELAAYYRVSMAGLLGETELAGDSIWPATITFDLDALSSTPDALPLVRFLEAILLQRGELLGSAVTVRRSDISAACAVMSMTEAELLEQLQRWQALVPTDMKSYVDQ